MPTPQSTPAIEKRGYARQAAGKKGLLPKESIAVSTLPHPYQQLQGQGVRMIAEARASKQSANPPFALGEPSAPTSPAVVVAAASRDALDSAIAAKVGGSSTRLCAAFAKKDQSRQGKLAPAEFAKVCRELGVSCSVGELQTVPGMCADVAAGTIDYLAYVRSLEPKLRDEAAAVAAKPAAPAEAPRSKLDQRRLFGEHAQTPRSQISFSGDAGGAAAALPPPPPPPVLVLHHHGAFAAAAGKGADPSSPSALQYQSGLVVSQSIRRQYQSSALPSDADRLIFSSTGAPTSPRKQRADGPVTVTRQGLTSFADVLIFGHHMGLPEAPADLPSRMLVPEPATVTPRHKADVPAVSTDDRGKRLVAPAALQSPHNRAQAPDIISGRLSPQPCAPPLTETLAAAFDGAAGLDSHGIGRALRTNACAINAFDDALVQPSRPRALGNTVRPHHQSTADSVIFGHDLDASDSRTHTHPEAEAAREAGAAGQYTPREAHAILGIDHIDSKRHVVQTPAAGTRTSGLSPVAVPSPRAAQQSSRAVASSLRYDHGGMVSDPSVVAWTSEASPRSSRRRAIRQTSAVPAGEPPFGLTSAISEPSSPRSFAGARYGGRSPASANGSASKVLRLAQSPPIPPSRDGPYRVPYGTNDARPQPVTLSAPPTPGQGPPLWFAEAQSPRSAGQASASKTPSQLNQLSSSVARAGASSSWLCSATGVAAGRSTCSLDPWERTYGGQIAATGGF